jgi:hypothetical protein
MKKIILIALFGIFASFVFASIKVEPTGDSVDGFQVFNIICDSYSEYEERLETFLNDETIQVLDRFEEEKIIQVICKKYICIEE